MGIIDLLWLFIIFASLSPMFKQRLLEMERNRLIRQLEKKRGSRVITLIHRQETMFLLGIPFSRYIDIEDSEEVLRAIRLTPEDMPIDLILHTPGGLVLAAEQIAHALVRHKAPVTVFVPHYAMSGGTLIALAADKIVMDENAVLGPVDPQLGQYPAASVLKVLEQKDINEIDDTTLILADVAEKARRQVFRAVKQILTANGLDEQKAEKLAEALSSGQWTHDYPITLEEARDLGLPVSDEMPEEVYALMSLYRQPAQRRPSVQYIPVPYRREDGTRGGRR
ncbi:MAG TPA: hypothetical protein ENG33_03975 [Chloroflexi bacterium]|nr:hypothetical protein [Chloroflexota bacterium]